jgi:hypothetical protein
MPEQRNYDSHLSLDAVAFVVALPRRKQKLVLDLADQIAAHPFQIGDYQTVDAAGRSIENLLLENYLFSFWVDHASREVRISEIIRV